MFWNKKKNKKPKALSGDELRAQAMENARAARENLGEDTVNRIAEIMAKKQHSPVAKAKAQIAAADQTRVEDSIRDLLDE
jgi:hypothetical protein